MLSFIEREIVLWSFKHIFNEILWETKPHNLPDVVAHLLNCMLAGENILKALNNRKIKPEEEHLPEVSTLEKIEKKKSKKSKWEEASKTEVEEAEPEFKVSTFFKETFNPYISAHK